MIIQPLSTRARLMLLAPIWIPLAVVVAPVALAVAVVEVSGRWIDRKLNPPGWRKHFAWRPVECDSWPDEGFSGWVWLETVWRNRAAPGWTDYRREPPADEAVLAAISTAAA